MECGSLVSVTIPNSVTTIEEGTFYNCRSLTSVDIPNSVTSIGKEAFYYCRSLTLVEIPNSVTSIGKEAFYCSGLTSVTSLAENPPICNGFTFNGHGTLYVPRNCKAVYKAAPEWCKFYEIKEIGMAEVEVLLNDETMGSVTGVGNYEIGASVSLEALPNSGYHFVKWDDGNTANPRTLTVTDDITLTAEFAPNTYMVTVSVNDAVMGSVTGGGEYENGESVTLRAWPNKGYHFLKWDDGNTDNPRALTVTEDITFTAEFVPDIYKVEVSVNDETMGHVTGGGEYENGESAMLEAIPNEGYHFVRWSDYETANPRTLTVTRDLTLRAVFAEDERYTVTVVVNDEAMGRVEGGGVYDAGAQVTLTAIPNPGYRFKNWDSYYQTDNPRTITVTYDITVKAVFERDPTSDPGNPGGPGEGGGTTANEASLAAAPFAYVQDRTVYLSDGLGEVEAFTSTGQRVYKGSARSFTLPQPGVYILRVVADGRRSKVVVR